ncbi:MAG: lipoyl(octanoyl) transferase LipB [Prevotellaceae bacterium]|nr:lipoyl(octanoyl) transferase LipB [Prevotellaceae bacterium]
MPPLFTRINLGTLSYREAWQQQEILHAQLVDEKSRSERSQNFLLFVEHPHVYTLGKNGHEANLLADALQLQSMQAELVKTNRGGDITYHGPGQLVAYPILRLDQLGIGVKQYVERLEEVVIRTVAAYGLHATRLPQAAGVWLDPHSPRARKLCAIGVRCSHAVTMHGFALNVNTDLRCFALINPCGFTDKGVTSLANELGRGLSMDEVRAIVCEKFEEVFGAAISST